MVTSFGAGFFSSVFFQEPDDFAGLLIVYKNTQPYDLVILESLHSSFKRILPRGQINLTFGKYVR